jgi:hypothetical protein
MILLPVATAAGLYQLFYRNRIYRQVDHKWRRLLAGNILVLMFLLSLCCAMGEIYYRFIHDTTDAYGLTRTSVDWKKRHMHLYQSGFRDSLDRYEITPTPGQRRVTIIGDSFTVGHGVKNVEDRFANIIRHERPQWEVHVRAKNGAETYGHTKMLIDMLKSGYKLQDVVLVYVLNDISDLSREFKIQMMPKNPTPWIAHHSYFINTLYMRRLVVRRPQLRGYYPMLHDLYDGPTWPKQQERLTQFHHLVRAAGGRLWVVTFPFLHELGDAYPYR